LENIKVAAWRPLDLTSLSFQLLYCFIFSDSVFISQTLLSFKCSCIK